jgi:hypothetical protein
MKLKTNKTLTEKPRNKIRNQKNKNQIEKYIIFGKLRLNDKIENI